MKRALIMIGIVPIILLLVMGDTIFANDLDKPVRAKIGIKIQSGDRVTRAKARDRLTASDLLRIYIHPEEACQILVVYSDDKTSTLLTLIQQNAQNATVVMPSLDTFYQVDGESPRQTFTIICSPNTLTEALEVLRNGEAPFSQWAKVEQRLLERSHLDLNQQTQKPFSIAGNVRGVGGDARLDPFVDQLQIFSGRSLLVKKYAFQVEK